MIFFILNQGWWNVSMYGQFNNLVSLSYTKSKKERVIQRDHSLSEKCGETRGDKEERKEKKNGGRNKYNY